MTSVASNSSVELPLSNTGVLPSASSAVKSRRSKIWLLLPAVLLFFAGGVVGMYFQPPGLKVFFGLTGLKPGGGTDTPIALAIEKIKSQDVIAVISEGDVVALGRVIPEGNVITIAPPFGSADARIAEISVSVGELVEARQQLAILDNLQQINAEIGTAKATVALREATLLQVERSVQASTDEAQASLERAVATSNERRSQLKRSENLFKDGVTTRAELDQSQLKVSEADRDVERAEATVSRYLSVSGGIQPDIAVAQANLQLANAELSRFQVALEKAIVRAPSAGTVLNIHVQAGENPGQAGILDLGNTDSMNIEVEVYQSLIARVTIGDLVTATSESIEQPLSGQVTAIGLEIGRQSITSDDPAVNTDARVVDVIVTLDEESSVLASRFTNLEVIARIDAGRLQ
jgi:HlyD family secretion protein